MAYAGSDFSPANPTEVDLYSFDLTSRLLSGEALASAGTWSIGVVSGTDSMPSLHLTGNPTLVGNITTQKISNLIAGVTYILQVTVSTTAGRIVVEYSHVQCVNPS